MRQSKELQIGKAGEYLVCADLIKKGYVAYLSEQGLPYDVILDNGKIYRIQVKTTLEPRKIPQRAKDSYGYIFNVKRHGINNQKHYSNNEVDIFALVALDSNIISYMPFQDLKSTMIFRVPEKRNTYYDEQGIILKEKITEMKKIHSLPEISKLLDMKLSNVYKYSANVDITPKGNNNPTYLDELTLEKCMEKL